MKKLLVVAIILIIISSLYFMLTKKNMSKEIRQPAVAGQFYPAEPNQLKKQINNYLTAAKITPPQNPVRAIMVPHAGYDFSGPVAAYSYKSLEGASISRVILIGSAHYAFIKGAAIDNSDEWQTPLGTIAVDLDLVKKLKANDSQISFDRKTHAPDHVLEVQLPFLQTVLPESFKIVPILLGEQVDYQALAEDLAKYLTPNDLIVISSDMSHYPAYGDAYKIDQATLSLIKNNDLAGLEKHSQEALAKIGNEQTALCGQKAVEVGMALAQKLNWSAEILHYANSGDVSIGSKDQVVGYGALIWSSPKTTGEEKILTSEQKKILLNIAKETITSYVKNGKIPKFQITDKRLTWPEGAFVTLTKNGQLRGCIGQIIGTGELWRTIQDMAIAAATEDYRFTPVQAKELSELNYEVSVLSTLEKITDWQTIKLGQNGVVIKQGSHTGVFLPEVATETKWSLEEFLSHLCSDKAELKSDCYKDQKTEISIFTTQSFEEK